MIKKSNSIARERYDAPACEELNVRIESMILAGSYGDEGTPGGNIPDDEYDGDLG